MNNIKLRVLFDGPDASGIFSATVGKYIRFAATHMDAETKESMAQLANDRANITMDTDDDAIILVFCSEVVSAKQVKEDLAGCIENDASQYNPEDCEECGCAAGEFGDENYLDCGYWECPECGQIQ